MFWRWGVKRWLFLGIVGALVVFGLAYSKTHQMVIPLVIAVIIGILLEPAVEFMTRHHVPRWLATLIMMIVIIALASQGLTAGIIMLVLVILFHTVMQNPVQAIAYGKTLQLHPLVALLVTLLGAVFGGIFGAILSVPITAVFLKVSRELKRVRNEESGGSPYDDLLAAAEEESPAATDLT